MAGVGRPSTKKQKIYNVYRILRCAMVHEDVQELLDKNPGFCERTIDDTDTHLLEAVYEMAEAMLVLKPPDISQAEPLGR